MRITVLAVCLIAGAGLAGAATPPKEPVPSKAAASPKAVSKPATPAKAAAPNAASAKAAVRKGPRPPSMERLTCRTGPNDEQARLIAQVVKGRTMEFAYYSRLGTRVCSIHARRGDAYSKWADGEDGNSTVKLLHGTAALQYKPGYLKIDFDDVDRMTFCGMHGEINATIEVTKNKAECAIKGVFDLGTATPTEEPKKDKGAQAPAEPKKDASVQAPAEPKKDAQAPEEPKQAARASEAQDKAAQAGEGPKQEAQAPGEPKKETPAAEDPNKEALAAEISK